MDILPPISNIKRNHPVSLPDATLFPKSIGILAAGILSASVYTCEIDRTPRFIFLGIGIVLIIIAVILLIRYIKQVTAFKKYKPAWEKHKSIYDDFAIELNHWYDSGLPPKSCDGDTSYALRLQRERLGRKGIRMIHYTAPAKETPGTTYFSRNTAWYTVDLMNEHITRRLRFENSSGIIYDRDSDDTMYESVVHTPNEAELHHMTMTCPNCGAVNPVAALTQGCPYCSTVFQIKDLFPRVTNTYFIRNNASMKNVNKRGSTIWITMLVVFLFTFISFLSDRENPIPASLIMSYFVTLIFGGITGLMLSSVLLIIKQFNRDGRKRIPFWSYVTAKGKISRAFAPYDPVFSFEKFEGQIIALIRMTVLADHPENLAFYRGSSFDPYFQDIIEMTYMQALTVNDIHMEGSELCLNLRTWWINYSEHDGAINRRGDCIDVSLRRNTAYMEPPGFSITSVHCPACGASFDSVRQRICPYCGNEYHMENAGFIIEKLELS